jgi:hypothetical protein
MMLLLLLMRLTQAAKALPKPAGCKIETSQDRACAKTDGMANTRVKMNNAAAL